MTIQRLQSKKMENLERLNEGQRQAFDTICKGYSTFVTGPGGTGKSFLINLLFTQLPSLMNRKVALTALTGCASLLLHSTAKTIHSWAGIGLGRDCVPLLVKNVKKNRKAVVRWLETDVLVIDEVSMMTPELFEKLDQVGRKIRRNEHHPFGGLQLVLVGDFYQLPPITKDSEETSFLFESELWKSMNLQICPLTEIVRQKDPVFQEVLNQARVGKLSKKGLRLLASRMDLDVSKLDIKPTMLFTRRAQVDDINMSHLNKLKTEKRTFHASTIFLPTASTQGLTSDDPLVQRAVAKLDVDAPYSPELVLAVGAQVMLIKNLDFESGLVNGSRGVVIGYGRTGDPAPLSNKDGVDPSLLVPFVKFRNGIEQAIEHETWEVPDFKGVLRKQIPLILGYAVTIHKCQGATLDCALVDVGGKTFEYGQAYVALSRVKDVESLYIHDLEMTAFRAHPKVSSFYSEDKNNQVAVGGS